MPRRSAHRSPAKRATKKPTKPPAPARAPGRQEKKYALLAAYQISGRLTTACEIVGVSRPAHYVWMKADPAYAAAYEASKHQVAELLEDEAIRRAREGTNKPVFHQGKVCGHIREFSDLLLIFMLKALRPGVYRESIRHDHEGKVTLEQLVAASRLPEHDHA